MLEVVVLLYVNHRQHGKNVIGFAVETPFLPQRPIDCPSAALASLYKYVHNTDNATHLVLATMKLLITSTLLLILSTITVHGSAVFDVSGKPVKSGTYYHITSAIWGAGGGGLFPSIRNEICPRDIFGCSLNVAQSPSDLDLGLPVAFHPFNSHDKIVELDSDVKIEFNYALPLNEPATWQIEMADESNGVRYVTIGGAPNAAHKKNNWFKIQKGEHFGYKLMYCPSVPESEDTCGNLGITVENGKMWLALSDKPFLVMLVKAESPEGISQVTE